MKTTLLAFLVVMTTSCSMRSNTAQLWGNLDSYVVIEEKYLTAQEIHILKSNYSKNIVWDERGAFYIKQEAIERAGYSIPVVLLTPITLFIDGIHFVAKTAIVPDEVRKTQMDDQYYHPTYLAVKKFTVEHADDASVSGGSNISGGFAVMGLLNAMGAIGMLKL